MRSLIKGLKIYLFGSSRHRVSLLYSLSLKSRKTGLPRFASYLLYKLEKEHGVFIHRSAQLAKDITFPHPTGIVIGSGVIIERNVTIYQQVTLGGARKGDYSKNNYPFVCKNTTIYAGAKILGKIRIGENCVIGANAVVTKDVPDNHVATGIPARIRPLPNVNEILQ